MNKKLLSLTIIILLFSCSHNQDDFSSDTLAEKACECMNREDGKGTIDERLSTCLMNSISANAGMIQATYYPNEAPDKAVEKHFYKITSNMIHNCDSYYSEMDKMYTNMYPKTDYSELKYNIDSITDSLENLSLSDSVAINLLHEKIMLLTRSRKYDEALDAIDIMTSQYSRGSETHWVKAYIYRDQKKYKEAIEELDKAISIGNESTIIFKELIVEKMKR